MDFRSNLNYAPDGFAASLRRRMSEYAAAARPAGSVSEAVGGANGRHQEQHHLNQDGYDEGLVHSHGWARDR